MQLFFRFRNIVAQYFSVKWQWVKIMNHVSHQNPFSSFATLLPHFFFCEMEALNYFEFPALSKLFLTGYLKDKALHQRRHCCQSVKSFFEPELRPLYLF